MTRIIIALTYQGQSISSTIKFIITNQLKNCKAFNINLSITSPYVMCDMKAGIGRR